MSLGQTRDTPLFYGQQLCEVLFRSNLAVRSNAYWFWTCVYCNLDFGVMTFGQGHYTTLGHRQRLCEILSRSNMTIRPGHGFWLCVHSDLNLGDTILGQGHDTPFGHGQQYLFLLCQILSRLDKGVRQVFWVCVHCHHDLGYMTLAEVITPPLVMDNGQFWLCVHCGLKLRDMTLGHGHVELSMGHGQQLCQILSRSDKE